ncbi:MAG: EF-P lysine aminoacylase GenX [Deltaproteobacteria bacterium]|nr:EF-P lysine aminoacylase GenX [Deltaproteobacteria bacterium]
MNDAVRSFFDQRGFLEVDTPIAVRSPGLEPHLFAYETTEFGPDGARETLYLHTSPEYAMKRMLGRGIGSIYQIARVFRNGERSRTHTPEFTMLEWYRFAGTLEQIMDDTEALVRAVADAVGGPWRPSGSARLSVTEAFTRRGLADPLSIDDSVELAKGLSVKADPADSWDDIFFKAFFKHVEPSFDRGRTTILHGYPARMAALAKIDTRDPRSAERFELFVGPMELGNAFGELTDPVEQRARFEADQRARASSGAPVYPIDEGLLADLGGIGQAAGIAVGLDRLLMSCLGVADVADVVPFAPR